MKSFWLMAGGVCLLLAGLYLFYASRPGESERNRFQINFHQDNTVRGDSSPIPGSRYVIRGQPKLPEHISTDGATYYLDLEVQDVVVTTPQGEKSVARGEMSQDGHTLTVSQYCDKDFWNQIKVSLHGSNMIIDPKDAPASLADDGKGDAFRFARWSVAAAVPGSYSLFPDFQPIAGSDVRFPSVEEISVVVYPSWYMGGKWLFAFLGSFGTLSGILLFLRERKAATPPARPARAHRRDA